MASWIRSTSVSHGLASKRRQIPRTAPAQRGFALFVALIFLILLSGYGVATLLTSNQAERDRESATEAALAEAKLALIAYAVTYAEMHNEPNPPGTPGGKFFMPGYLPCPELNPPTSPANEGKQTTTAPCSSGGRSHLGRLPWRELQIEPPKDSAGQCLWYAVAATIKRRNYAASPGGPMINWDTPGKFDIVRADDSNPAPVYLAGPDPSQSAVAVIIAPGPALPGKSPVPQANATRCGGSYTASDYLDVADGVDNSFVPDATNEPTTSFVVAPQSDTFNDRLVYITAKEIFEALERSPAHIDRLRQTLNHVAHCIAGFGKYNQSRSAGDLRLPWPANVAISETSLSDYRSNLNYRDLSINPSGRVPWRAQRSCDLIRGKTCPATEAELFGDATVHCPAVVPANCSAECPIACVKPCPTCAEQCPAGWNEAQDAHWYYHYKDQMFYAVAANYLPDTALPTAPCPNCLSVNNAGSYAAVLMFSGSARGGKKRSTIAERASVASYLEGRNETNYSNSSGDGNYQAQSTTKAFNDMVVCIDQNLRVIDPCSP